MDQFSHDLTLALEETSLMDRAYGVGRWGSRRRTRSTGNLPCAPQPTEDSSSSPTDTLNSYGPGHSHNPNASANVDGLDTHTHSAMLPASDSDDKTESMLLLRLPSNAMNAAAAVRMGMGALESDSLNETNFSPARFYKPNSRRKRKIKRMSMDFEFSKDSNLAVSPHNFTESPLHPGMLGGCMANPGCASGTASVRKRLLKSENNNRSNMFFCGKRKRSNRDRYHDLEQAALGSGTGAAVAIAGAGNDTCRGSSSLHSSSMPRYTHIEEYYRMRPRSYSSTSKPNSDRLLPLNKKLLSKIDRIAQSYKTDATSKTGTEAEPDLAEAQALTEDSDKSSLQRRENDSDGGDARAAAAGDFGMECLVPVNDIESLLSMPSMGKTPNQLPLESRSAHRKKSHHIHVPGSTSTLKGHRRRRFCQTPQPLQVQSMDCSELYDFLSSSSLSSSSDSEDGHIRHDTDGEGDDELTDWPGNDFGPGGKYDPKRKLTKKSMLPQIRSDDTIGEDDTLMSGTETAGAAAPPPPPPLAAIETLDGGIAQSSQAQHDAPQAQHLSRFQPAASSEPIEICGVGGKRINRSVGFIDVNIGVDMESNMNGLPPTKQIESEMSGETSNPFLSSSPPMIVQEVREIRAGCRRINGDRPGFSIKLSVNERLARFLQDPRQTQIRLPDIEIYEHDSLLNLSTLYSLTMVVEHGCTVLTKTRNTTQSVDIDAPHQRSDLLSDFKRRCYGGTAEDDKGAEAATAAAKK